MSSLDHKLCVEMEGYVEQLTTSGQPTLDEEVMKKFKKICKRSDEYVKHAYHLAMMQLKQEHAEIRLSAFQIIEELFKRSHQFRELLISDFQDFLELTVETDPEIPLPPPKETAKNLKSKTLRAIQYWNDTFADGYKKLALGYNFLKNCKKVDFHQMRMQSQAEERREQEKERKKQILRQTKLNNLEKDMKDTAPDIIDCLNQLDNCFRLLLPNVEDFEVHGQEEFFANSLFAQNSRTSQNELLTNSGKLDKCDSQSGASGTRTAELSGGGFKDRNHEVTSSDPAHISNETKQGCNRDPQRDTGTESNDSGGKTIPHSSSSTSESNTENDETSNKDPNSDDTQPPGGSGDEDDDEDEYAEESVDQEFVQAHGLGSRRYNLSITVETDEFTIEETDDNTDILHCLRDLHRLVSTRFLPGVVQWLEILGKNGGSEDKVKQCVDIKRSLEAAKKKYEELKIVWISVESNQDNDDEDEDEGDNFEDVPQKDGYEADIPEHLKLDMGPAPQLPASSNSRKVSDEQDIMDPTTFASNMARLRKILHGHEKARIEKEAGDQQAEPSTSGVVSNSSRKRELLKKAPVVKFGVDLMGWGEEKEAPTVMTHQSLHRWWTPAEVNESLPKGAMDMLQSRAIEFTGKFEPVKWKCRAMLPNGKLCERMDRVKCPFHGKIISRDDMGNPTSEKDARELAKKGQGQLADWQDPELLRDIEAETGRDLTVTKKGKGKGKGRQRKYPNLTDLREKTNTSRRRLESKVFNRAALKRVAGAMDSMDDKMKKERFGHTFLSTFPNRV